ncbi:hypothetical protein BDZ45DRAFT_126151 [Acephala macrosclerotiorum]|nr:hypothetical protein BDZ45DRAFT_126151 [Acephala macrosclerotiorum]
MKLRMLSLSWCGTERATRCLSHAQSSARQAQMLLPHTQTPADGPITKCDLGGWPATPPVLFRRPAVENSLPSRQRPSNSGAVHWMWRACLKARCSCRAATCGERGFNGCSDAMHREKSPTMISMWCFTCSDISVSDN